MSDDISPGHETRQVVRELLGAMTEGREVRAWLKQFTQLERQRFAIIKIGGGTLRDEMPTICSALSFLQKLGLSPVIVHGGGPQIDDALRQAGIETPRIDGLRVTSPAAMPVIASALREVSLGFVSALNAKGANAVFCPAETVQATLIEPEKLGRVGTPSRIDFDAIAQITQNGQLPILSSVAMADDGQEANINADALVRELAIGLQPQKIIFLTPTGAILDADGGRISAIHLLKDYETIIAEPWLLGGMKLKLQQINDMLEQLPLTTSAAITSPDQLVKELFTHGGSGTLIRKGEKTPVICQQEQLDEPALRGLIETAFGRTLLAEYWQNLDFAFAIASSSNRALALVTRQRGHLYLDKFAVSEQARGEGLGAAVWKVLLAQAPVLFWRSRISNPVNPFYFAEADGSAKSGDWRIFWCGQIDWADLPTQIEHIANLDDTFVETAP
ncbi:Acetylglutamate kinase [hydrothermal vent metagenome]|uniref:acetylglutamate kinase n=1 Tax=hydrothermal vent metagenome TaxID=652676 RepID=A0A3B0RSV9_9ZZZZ